MSSLHIASKAPLIGYPALIAAAIVNAASAEAPIKVDFVDDKVAAADQKAAAVKLVLGETTVYDTAEALMALAEAYPEALSEKDASSEWVKFAFEELAVKDFKKLSVSLEKLDAHLNFRSFMLGYQLSVADVAVWGVLRANAVMGSVIKTAVYQNVTRWYLFVEADKRFGTMVELMTASLNELRKTAKAAAGGKKEGHKASFDIELKGATDGQVVTRFPPEPSGYLHIGHAKAAILNKYFADMYHGKLIIRFDDTNPSKEKEEFQDSITEDLKLLGIIGDKTTFSSDYFQVMYEYAVQMITEGKAYCDDTVVDKMREERMDGIASARRERSVEENLRIFNEMKNGTEEGLKNCLRAKIDYTALNKTLRDPVIYRTNLTPHHRTGTAWKIYPTYDFCCPIVDSLEGVTHALRTIEYRDRNAQYEWMLNALNLRKVHIWDFARINFVRTLLSKRKLQWFVDKQLVPNWDDPRFPTVRGVRRRGMTVEGLKNFIVSQGPSKNIINLDWNLIWAVNKKVIDPTAPRHTALNAANLVKVHLSNGAATPFVEKRPKHKKNPEVGEKDVIFGGDLLLEQEDAATLEDGEEATLMDWGNVIINKIHKEGDVIKAIDATLHLEGDFRKTKHKVNWLADTTDVVTVELVDFDHLIVKDKIEDGENFEDFLTPETEFRTTAVADTNVSQMKQGDIIQFERKGYYRLDAVAKDGKPAVFFTIPDGKAINRYGAKK